MAKKIRHRKIFLQQDPEAVATTIDLIVILAISQSEPNPRFALLVSHLPESLDRILTNFVHLYASDGPEAQDDAGANQVARRQEV